ncbi:MAG: hypothetical protein ACYC8T_00180 [Myxococcaceae bacterium]
MSALDAKDRTAITDALRPPPGYRLAAGLGTTFSLEFQAFTAIILALVGADLDEGKPDAPSVLTAVARLRHKLRLFVSPGRLIPPPHPSRLFALYDRITRPVPLDRATFHPKVWALEFEQLSRPELKRQPNVLRLVCSSRNVTDSQCWELGARFDGRAGTPSDLGRDVAAFGRRLAKADRLPLPRLLYRMLDSFTRAEFDVGSEAAEALRLFHQWPGEPPLSARLPKRASRAVFISPFVRADLLRELAARVEELTVVSRQDELDALSNEAHEALSSVRKYVVTGAADDDVPALELHAKLLAWESATARETLVGSANATGAGWGVGRGGNCEAMVALRPGLGIDAILRGFVSPAKGELHGWIEEYRRTTPEVDEGEHAQKRLEALRRELAAVAIHGKYDSAARTLTLTASPSKGKLPPTVPPGVSAGLVPLLLAGDPKATRPFLDLYGGGATFSPLERIDLSAFAVVRLRNEEHDRTESFGLQFHLELSPDEEAARDDALHAHLIESFDPRVLLLNILHGLPAGSGGQSQSRSAQGTAAPGNLLGQASFERVMEVCTMDPGRIEEVDALLSACKGNQAMAGFGEFWRAFKGAIEEADRDG